MNFETIQVEVNQGVGIITLNRPKAMNALNVTLTREVGEAVDAFERDDNVGCMIITGGEQVFAAGADIKEMKDQNFVDLYSRDFPYIQRDCWRAIDDARKPIIAAVAGFALGGGCEMAMACDFIIAADSAKFGQPEIGIGTMPGAGGTQRLTKAVGKAKAMELCLTGRMMDAEEAEKAGLVSRIVPAAELAEQAFKTARKIAGHSRPVVMLVKEAVNMAVDADLQDGLKFERRTFEATFAFEDCKEGMAAFAEKRKPEFKHC
ncbi:enoyl-CoA hydratase-related protein [Marinobacterium arenosum]|uniref:enoyl-CoA hydratase-related protein n=1 Tax=Marinobacterium arenosum TaxID=2862496 RepID=UPI001C93F1D0|nr:enoyl-CoA hydratase-related protein [Marinobacterium arenosum]MBY4677159.1 enoyl-CoA hydratase/isomerase family protein [Marinobacterium arenosum]